MLKGFLVFICIVTGSLVGGFSYFLSTINTIETTPAHQVTDGIVVFTGGTDRVSQATQLLKNGTAKRLLISGVHQSTTATAIAQQFDIEEPLLACCIDLDHSAMDTVGNAVETAKWARSHNYTSIRLVTAAYHIPRSMAELKRNAPKINFYAHPINSDRIPLTVWWQHPDTTFFLIREYAKYLVAVVRWRLKIE